VFFVFRTETRISAHLIFSENRAETHIFRCAL